MQRFKLKKGESFELDKKNWIVAEIRPNQAVFRVENNQMTLAPADVFFSATQIPVESPPEDVGEQDPDSEVEAEETEKSDVS